MCTRAAQGQRAHEPPRQRVKATWRPRRGGRGGGYDTADDTPAAAISADSGDAAAAADGGQLCGRLWPTAAFPPPPSPPLVGQCYGSTVCNSAPRGRRAPTRRRRRSRVGLAVANDNASVTSLAGGGVGRRGCAWAVAGHPGLRAARDVRGRWWRRRWRRRRRRRRRLPCHWRFPRPRAERFAGVGAGAAGDGSGGRFGRHVPLDRADVDALPLRRGDCARPPWRTQPQGLARRPRSRHAQRLLTFAPC
ncbi:hypothetical protein I4F81_004667 [Pyropia yezoensis]|uniref:Uncharacterized protein n=1 Tax=Pyropia yezoensis TaxID=2788 RepID=A0ACC3BWL8_PYRYE|nr:hypothetical protein I4F81_004667 [Neopyropia yezoensis]